MKTTALLLITFMISHPGLANATIGSTCKGVTSNEGGDYEKILVKIDLEKKRLQYSTYASNESKPTGDEIGPTFVIKSLKHSDGIATLVATHSILPQPGYLTTLTLTIDDSAGAGGSSHIQVEQEGMVHGHPVKSTENYGITCH